MKMSKNVNVACMWGWGTWDQAVKGERLAKIEKGMMS